MGRKPYFLDENYVFARFIGERREGDLSQGLDPKVGWNF
jgi:hypothetical protein